MTTEPNEDMKKIHNRMPVILHESDEKLWLDPKLSQDNIEELLLPTENKRLQLTEISTAVNSVRNNSPDVLIPVH